MRLSISLLCKILPKSSYFVTTPIFYVNGEPHIGHLHTLLLADVLHRYHKLRGCNESIFSTGTDEHGLKIQRAADSCQMRPLDFCDKISGKFLNLCEAFDINPTHFIRTTDPSHKKSVQQFWNTLSKNGYIYKSYYEGWYSVPDETFVGPHDIEEKIVNDKRVKVFSQTGHVLEWLREENYMFKLSAVLGDLKNWLASRSVSIKPAFFHEYLISVIDKGLDDLSISRPKTRLEWGIPVPDDDSQIIYVWLDALVNYLTVSGYPNELRIWPPDCHVIGKDIINFHAIYWPAFLMAAGLEPPKTILCHSHWTVNDVKMSKSKGNVVNPLDLIEPFSIDGVRYYFIRQAVPTHDANFSPLQMKRFLNSELADTLGNLLLRSTAPAINTKQIYPATPSDLELSSLPGISEIIDSLASLKNKVEENFESANFSRGLADMMHPVRLANKLFDEIKPWILVKRDPNSSSLTSAIYIALEVIRINAILLQPVVPSYSEKLLSKLNVVEEERLWSYSIPYLGASSRKECALTTTKIIPFRKVR